MSLCLGQLIYKILSNFFFFFEVSSFQDTPVKLLKKKKIACPQSIPKETKISLIAFKK